MLKFWNENLRILFFFRENTVPFNQLKPINAEILSNFRFQYLDSVEKSSENKGLQTLGFSQC